MNKLQAYHGFWSGFTWKAYDETSVPDGVAFPYITYEVSEDFFDNNLMLTVSLWDRSESWQNVIEKSFEISDNITAGGRLIKYEDGAFWIRRGNPWAQRMSDSSDDSVRRIVLNVIVEYIDQ